MTNKRPRGYKSKKSGFKFSHLLLAILIPICLAGVGAGYVITSRNTNYSNVPNTTVKDYSAEWTELYKALGIFGLVFASLTYQKINKPNGNRPSDPSPNPVKPKPFNPPPFQDVREVEEGNHVGMARELLDKHEARQAERMSMKELLELSHNDKSKPVSKPVYPISVPYQVRAMVNGNEKLALRLYSGIADRYTGKSEQWVWEKVVSDLERDRR